MGGLLLVRPPRLTSGSHPHIPPSTYNPPVLKTQAESKPKEDLPVPTQEDHDSEEELAKTREQELENELKEMGEDFQLDIDDLDLEDFENDLDEDGVIVDLDD